jgi:hypothetical protein
MRRLHIAILAGAAVALAAGTAVAETAKTHTMNVALPDGSTAHIEYAGDVAPKVTVKPAQRAAAFDRAYDPFANLDRMMAAMEARHQEVLQQMAAMERSAGQAAQASPGQLIASGNMPAGSQFTMVQSTTDANGCTRTVRYSSDGSSQQPQKTETSSGKCGKAEAKAAPAPAEEAPARQYVPGAI